MPVAPTNLLLQTSDDLLTQDGSSLLTQAVARTPMVLNDADNVMSGDQEVEAIYAGATQVWARTPPEPPKLRDQFFWPDALPSNSETGSPGPLNLGFRFSPLEGVMGALRGVRFYKIPEDTGVHTATVWDNSGVKIAQMEFTAETASGWQEVFFDKELILEYTGVNQSYTVAVHRPTGNYGYNPAGDFDSPNLVSDEGLLECEYDGYGFRYNGVSRSGTPDDRPSANSGGLNYFVDVIWEESVRPVGTPLWEFDARTLSELYNDGDVVTTVPNVGTAGGNWSVSGSPVYREKFGTGKDRPCIEFTGPDQFIYRPSTTDDMNLVAARVLDTSVRTSIYENTAMSRQLFCEGGEWWNQGTSSARDSYPTPDTDGHHFCVSRSVFNLDGANQSVSVGNYVFGDPCFPTKGGQASQGTSRICWIGSGNPPDPGTGLNSILWERWLREEFTGGGDSETVGAIQAVASAAECSSTNTCDIDFATYIPDYEFVPGDVAIVSGLSNSGSTSSRTFHDPAGYTWAQSIWKGSATPMGYRRSTHWYKVLDGTETSVRVACTDNNTPRKALAAITIYRGLDTTNPISATSHGYVTNPSGIHQTPSITPTANGAIHLTFEPSSIDTATVGYIERMLPPKGALALGAIPEYLPTEYLSQTGAQNSNENLIHAYIPNAGSATARRPYQWPHQMNKGSASQRVGIAALALVAAPVEGP